MTRLIEAAIRAGEVDYCWDDADDAEADSLPPTLDLAFQAEEDDFELANADDAAAHPLPETIGPAFLGDAQLVEREIRDLIQLSQREELTPGQQARLRELVDALGQPTPTDRLTGSLRAADAGPDFDIALGPLPRPSPPAGSDSHRWKASARPKPNRPRKTAAVLAGLMAFVALIVALFVHFVQSPGSNPSSDPAEVSGSAGWIAGGWAAYGKYAAWAVAALALAALAAAIIRYARLSPIRRPPVPPAAPVRPPAEEDTRTFSPPGGAARTESFGPVVPGSPNPTVTIGQLAWNVAAMSHPPTRPHTDSACPPPDLSPVLEKYDLIRHLGEGSFGTVFLAHPKGNPGCRVAIKFFVYGSTRRWRLLQAEVQRLAGLGGVPGIVGLLDVNADADPPHFVMPFAAGGSLADRLRTGGPLPPATVARLAGRIATTLAAVHGRGVVHCDLKPANVLLDDADQPLLADFGQAQLVGEDAPTLGTLYYMPPDQADPSPRPPDPRWDVYAFGALLFALLTGRPPHLDETLWAGVDDTVTLGEKLRRYRDGFRVAPPPQGHRRCCPDPVLCGVIDRCLCIDPAERYPDAAAVLADLIFKGSAGATD